MRLETSYDTPGYMTLECCMPKRTEVRGSWPTELQTLLGLHPKLLDHSYVRMCAHASINMLGALCLNLNKDDVMAHITEISNIPAPPRYADPVYIAENVPLVLPPDDDGTYQPLDTHALSVLMKQVCGRDLGLVLSGPYSGLMLNKIIEIDPSEGMCVRRLWNDTQITPKTAPPYAYYLPEDMYYHWEHPEFYITQHPVTHKLIESFHDRCNQNRWSTDILFELLTEANIPFDQKGFSSTRLVPNPSFQSDF